MTLSVGSRVGPYEIVGPLGKGGMGEVWRARDARLDRDVAIKALPESFAGDEERQQRFEREAKILAQLSHPHIAGLLGLEVQGGRRYLVMEYVPGATLDERLATGALPLDDALRISRQIADALEMAHEKGIVHRDLKPSNVMVLPDESVKVLDFGLARGGSGSGSASLADADVESPTLTADFTRPGVVLGTAPYMSPEQARGRAVDKRSDIWSFGVILFECLTGARLFVGETASDTIGAVLHQEIDFDALPPDTPAMVRVLLRRCLTRDRRQRLPHIGSARIELDAAIADPAGTSLGLAAVPVRARRTVTSRLPWLTAILLLLTAVGLTLALLSNATPATQPRVVRLSVPVPERPRFLQRIALAPDGSALAVPAPEGVLLWRFASGTATSLPIERGLLQDFGPDGRWLAFEENPGGPRSAKLLRLPLDGGPVTELGQLGYGSFQSCWLSDSELLTIHDDELNGACLGVFNTSTRRSVLFPQTRAALREMQGESWQAFRAVRVPASPDHVLVTAERFSARLEREAGPIWLVSLGTGEATRLVDEGAAPQVTATGVLVCLREHVLVGARLDLEAREIGSLELVLDQQVEVFTTNARGDLAFVPYAGPVSAVVQIVSAGGDPEPLDVHPRYGLCRRAIWSRDGRKVLVEALDGQGQSTLLVIDRANGPPQRIWTLPPSARFGGLVWSLDNRSITFERDDEDTRLYTIAADGQGTPTELAAGLHLRPCQWLDDERLLAVEVGDRSKGRVLVWAAGAEPRVLVEDVGRGELARISPDGAWLAYSARFPGDEGRIYLQKLTPDLTSDAAVDRRTLPTRAAWFSGFGWAADSRQLYVGAMGGSGESVAEVLDIEPRDPSAAPRAPSHVELPKYAKHDGRISGWDVLANGDVVFVEWNAVLGTDRVEVILDWASTLDAKLSGGTGR